MLTRAVFVGLLGALAALVGVAFLGLQRAGWIVLGSLYMTLGVSYLTGYSGRLARKIGPGLARLSETHGAVGLGVLFGLNIPACVAPLLGAVIGTAAIGGPAQIALGFLSLAIFGLALSLPLVLAVAWGPARRALDGLTAWSARAPVVIGLLLAVLGVWSVYLGLFAQGEV